MLIPLSAVSRNAASGVPLSPEEIHSLWRAKSLTEWREVCRLVRAARGGQLPPDWFATVMLSGLTRRSGTHRITLQQVVA